MGVHHDHELGVHELPQIGPYCHHDALGVAGIGLADGDHGDAVGTALWWQPEIHDFRELLLQ